MAEYELRDAEYTTRDGHRIQTRVRVRVDQRSPSDIPQQVVRAVRRALTVLDGARQAGLLTPQEHLSLARGRQQELRLDLPKLMSEAQAALDALNAAESPAGARAVPQNILAAPTTQAEEDNL